jgi:hypothetical protein
MALQLKSRRNIQRAGVFGLLVVNAVLAAAGCGSSSDANLLNDPAATRVTSPERRAIDQRPVDERVAEVEEFGRQPSFENTPAVVAALDDPSIVVRRAAVKAAERIVGYGVPINPYWPREKLQKAQSDYRRMLALAEEMGVEHFVDTVPALIDHMEDESPEVRRQAYIDIKRTTGLGYGFRPDGPVEQRQRAVNAYRKLWQQWNRSGSRALALLRDPNLRAAHNRARVAEMTSQQ